MQDIENLRDQVLNTVEAELRVETESQNTLIDVPGAVMTDVPDQIMEAVEERCPKLKFPKFLKFRKKKKKKKPIQPVKIVEPIRTTQVHNNDLIIKIWEEKKKFSLRDVENLRKRVLTTSDKVEEYGVVAAVQDENEGKMLNENTDEEFVPFMVSLHTGAIVKSVRLRVKKNPNSELDVSNVPCTSTDLEGECTNLSKCEPEVDKHLDACAELKEDTEEGTTQDVPQTSRKEKENNEDRLPLW